MSSSQNTFTARQQYLPMATSTNSFVPKQIQVADVDAPHLKNFAKNIKTISKNIGSTVGQTKQFAKEISHNVGFLQRIYSFSKSSIGRMIFALVVMQLLGKIITGTINGYVSTLTPNIQLLTQSIWAWIYIISCLLVLNYLFGSKA